MKRTLIPGWAPFGVSQLAAPIPGAVTRYGRVGVKSHSSVAAASPVRLRPPIDWSSERLASVDVVIALDESGSEYLLDPTGVRRAAALSLVKLLRRRGDATVGVIHWGSTAPEELVLPLTSVAEYHRIERALAIPQCGLGGTNVSCALAGAGRLLIKARNEARPVVVVITDGIEMVGPIAADQIDRLPNGCVHVVLVDPANTCSAEFEAGWRALGLGSFTRLDHVRTDVLGWQVADIVARAAGTAMSHPPTHHTNRDNQNN